MNSFLQKINSPQDLKSLKIEQLNSLSKEIRNLMINVISKNGGHLGSSLGVVELTIAIHRVFDTPNDTLIWDVGHQCYAHKIITGRRKKFDSIRKTGGLSGFPSSEESIYDSFETGHSSTSISASIGMALADYIDKKNNHHIAVVGDASIMSGQSFEALNTIPNGINITIILNDNGMSIDKSVGKIKNNFEQFFASLNIPYFGIVDGHSLEELISALAKAKKEKGVKIIHIKTTKGKGILNAEKNQEIWHAPGDFDPNTFERLQSKNGTKYQDVFGKTINKLIDKNDKILVLTPATGQGTGLDFTREKHPKKVIDVGISEQHCMTMAAGISKAGMMPIVSIYSTFLQRAYDQLIDVAIQKIPVIICVDRSGITGMDGFTHQGYFDSSFLATIPNMIVAFPIDEIQMQNLLFTAQLGINLPMIICYPKQKTNDKTWQNFDFKKIEIGTFQQIKKGSKIAIVTLGEIGQNAKKAISKIKNNDEISHYNMIFAKPINPSLIKKLSKYKTIITIENGMKKGGIGSQISQLLSNDNYKGKIVNLGIKDNFLEGDTIGNLKKKQELDTDSIKEKILQNL